MAKPKNITKEERLEKKRIAERLRYQKIKNDPTKLAAQKEKSRQKYLTRKEKGQRKLVSNMSDREKRQARKKWRNYSKTHYDKKTALEKAARKFVRENTPSSCDENVNSNQQQQVVNAQNVTPRLAQARKRALRQRKKRNQELQKKNDFIRSLKTKLQKYRKRYHRLKRERKEQLPQELTPCTKMKKLAENPDTRVEVVKKALFGDTLEKQLSENITNLSTKSEKRVANKLLMGRVVKKSKIWKLKNKLITYKKVWHSQKQNKLNEKTRKTFKNEVQKFLEDDQYSRLCAGKKEFITKNKVRKQKRYQLDTLRNLHKEFLKSGNVLISYSMFARLRPFWIVAPKVIDRDTCMCTLHSNIQLVVSALNTAKLLKDTSYQSLLTSLCCDRYNERCLERICELCSDKAISFSEDFDDTKLVTYQQWVSSREMIVDPKTKRERPVTKQKKENIETSARDLKVKLENDLVKLFKHELNIVHQYQSLKMIKQSLTEKDVVVHMDFSENYCTKYNEEIQSFHFGGSRTQLSLHTVVVYLKESTRSYCTVSTNLSHNVNAIWAHLKPVLEELPEKVENIHFLSDGPVTQYRNKYMFYVLACKIPDLCPGIINWTWNYTEAGHGKGAPDGVGAVCKRTADNIVAYGGNITNLNEFCGAIQTRCPNITLFVVNDSDIDDMSRLISEDQRSLIPFTGTLKVHQVQGNAYLPKRLIMKSLSCFCDNNGCEHYRLGLLKYSSESRNRVDAVYGNLDSERTEADSPTTSIMGRRPFTESGRVQSGISELDNLSTMSNLSLNLENPEILADMPDLEIDPTDLFPNETIASPTKAENSKKFVDSLDESKKGTQKSKINTDKDSSQADKTNKIKKITTKKKLKNKPNKTAEKDKKKKSKAGKAKRANDKESDDCCCLICGTLYSEDTTGNDWVQCILCRQWAQIGCIKSDSISFTCPDCSSDSDYKEYCL